MSFARENHRLSLKGQLETRSSINGDSPIDELKEFERTDLLFGRNHPHVRRKIREVSLDKALHSRGRIIVCLDRMNLHQPLNVGQLRDVFYRINYPLIERWVSHWRIIGYAIPVNVSHDTPDGLPFLKLILGSEAFDVAGVLLHSLHVEADMMVVSPLE